MDNGIYIVMSRQTALFRDMAATSNNLANANTTGYQAERLSFEQYLQKDNNLGSHNKMAFANDARSFRDTREGNLRHTGNPLDVAVSGDGYFMIETPNGVRYSRAGAFSLDGEGRLINADGYSVLDNAQQPIEFPPEANEIVIGKAGNISVNGEDFGTIGVARVQNPQTLVQQSGGLYKTDGEVEILGEDDITMAQGMLENSNVQPVVELTHMIEVSRAVGSIAKYMEAMYELQRKTVSTYTQQA